MLAILSTDWSDGENEAEGRRIIACGQLFVGGRHVKVREAIAAAFVAEGTTVVFGLMGDGNMLWMATIGRDPAVTLIHARHENAAVAMADGYARASGNIGVASITCGPGVTQIATSLVVAEHSRIPLVILAGETPTTSPFHLQEFDQAPYVAACGAGFVPVSSPDDVYAKVQLAFARARTERRPIVVSVPYDLQEQEHTWVVGEYVHSGELVVPPQRVAPDAAALAPVVAALADARRPVILAGRGAVQSGARDVIEALAEQTGSLLATTLLAKGWFEGSPWDVGICGAYSTSVARDLLAQADCVLGFGARLGFYTTEAGYMFPEAKVIRVDLHPQGYLDGMRVADLHVQGDAAIVATHLAEALKARGVRSAGYRTDATRASLQRDETDSAVFEFEPGTVDPRHVVAEMQAAIPTEWLVTTGVGHYWQFVVNGLHGRRPDRYITPYDFGAIGQGLPMAIGAAIASRTPTVLVEGDGSLLMYLEELECVVRQQIPLLVLVMNDGAYGAELHKMRSKGFHDDEALFGRVDFAAVAAALGIRGECVDGPHQLAPLVKEYARDRLPMLVDIQVASSVLSPQYRRLHFGQDA